ncbi:MAG: hypothetical protein LUO89_02045 [Methanothrix sp.]|nr:hypothetical protein [Methanothrix sp.]
MNRAKAMTEFIIIDVVSDNNADPVEENKAKYIKAENMVNPVINGRKKRKLAKTASKDRQNACQETNFVRPIHDTTIKYI